MSAQKRRRKSPGARLRPFWMLFVVLAVAIGVGLYYAATWPGFFPRQVSVSGNRIVPTRQILARAQIESDTNLWLQNMGAAARRIDAIPYVKDVSIQRMPPANARIVVTERVPFAVVRNGSRSVLVDHDLRVLKDDDGSVSVPLIVVKTAIPPAGAFIRAISVQRLRNDDDALTQAHVAVRALRFDRFDDLVATTRGGISLLLGDDDDLAKKTPLIDPIISQVSAGGRRLAAVDLRAPNTPVVVYKH
ncbi:MAG TPA: FtsQ-type POTRA domain-containing protein [Candidatus Baltobacteraceae bacterium]|nr:FtsQ-type POTRA domain-containing protein [Candidatus Baltobacteraceae bacterium]